MSASMDWEIKIPEMRYLMVFILPPEIVKNGEERLVVCNQTARQVVVNTISMCYL
ncbi:integrase [Legionella santicrucis]|uniref:Integrase n=1 Tax=Legionella santicrucis TaxID=45074 RepID=A0A0W0Z629_9GAMM|nr:hypothetical protein [Legionella santicrucis]KTD64592.1 integrase [Legionella santicrucis]